jgi:uncharacterized protein (DUF433 family)
MTAVESPMLDDVDEDEEVFDRITLNPAMLGGKPCVAGTRISVQFVLERLSAGESLEQIASDYRQNIDDLKQAVRFAASFMSASQFRKLNHQ